MDLDTLSSLIPSLNRDCIDIIESYIDKFRFKLICRHSVDDYIKDILLLEDDKIVYLTENNVLKIINTNGKILLSKILDNNFNRAKLLSFGECFAILYRFF